MDEKEDAVKKRRSGRRQLVSVILVLILLLLTGCRQDKQNEGKNGDTVEADGDRTPGTVSTDNSENGREQTTGAGELQMMKNGSGVAVTELNTLTEESLATLKKAGITFVKVHIPYPFDAGGNMSSNYLNAKRAVKLIAKSGLEPVCQSFTPGGNAYNQTTGQVEWMSYLPAVFENYDDEYFYKLIRQGCEYIGKDLKEYGNCWIISNEPNLTTFTGPMTNEQIVRYIQTCAEGIKTGNENAYCGVNIFGTADRNRAMRLIPMLYGEKSNLDYLGLDSYFGTLVEGGAEDWENYISTYYDLANVPIMITEFSYSSYVWDETKRANDSQGLAYNSPVCRNKRFSYEWTGHERTEQTQAEYAQICIDIFKSHPEVIGWCWFSNVDKDGPCWECGDTYCPMESSWGLLRSDGSKKPVLDVIGQQ